MQYLKQIGRSWYVRVVVPARLRAAIGKREYTVALKTRDVTTAKRLSHQHVARIVAELQAAEAHRTFPADSAEHILQVAREARAAVSKGLQSEDEAERGMDASVEKHLDLLRDKHGVDEEGDPKVGDAHASAIRLAHRIFQGEAVSLLSHQVDVYLAEVEPHVRAQTMQDKRRVYGEFRQWLVSDAEVGTITRKQAGSYVSTHMAKQGKAPKTLKSELAQLSALWKFMLARGVVEANVWSLISSTLPSSKRGGTQRVRRPWTEDELLKLFKDTDTSDPIWSVAALSLYGGFRVEEACQLKVADYKDGALRVRETKSEAGVRSVPVHPVIAPLVKRLASTSTDGYLLPGLLIAGRDKKRSVYLSKRAAWHLRKVLKFTDKNQVVHGLRHTFTSACERAGIPLSTAQLLVGHSRRGSITYGAPGASYSHGLPAQQLATEIAKVSFGAVDGLVKRTAGKVKVTHRSHRRGNPQGSVRVRLARHLTRDTNLP